MCLDLEVVVVVGGVRGGKRRRRGEGGKGRGGEEEGGVRLGGLICPTRRDIPKKHCPIFIHVMFIRLLVSVFTRILSQISQVSLNLKKSRTENRWDGVSQ